MTYEMDFSSDLAYVYSICHVSFLKKCISDPNLVVLLESVRMKESLSYEEIPVEILDCQVRKLRNKEVSSVKVLWMNQLVEDATWEGKVDWYHVLVPPPPPPPIYLPPHQFECEVLFPPMYFIGFKRLRNSNVSICMHVHEISF
ncbi:hypothetical protein MTR67_000860 [Solanum verrucosum]|uniref:Uncharacterized protein n=1 Tax=Solanum verrucosum TaxID=315347 RepID=A0AAF0PPD2_SOLVR|nr:hypothetical protein MTR67_000860 [Solanum verrucosum]